MAISSDLRRRAIEAYERGDGSIPAVASCFAISTSSLNRWLRHKREAGSIERTARSDSNPRQITPEGERLLSEWWTENPSIRQQKLAARLAEVRQPAISQQTVSRTLARMALTLNKKSFRAVQRLRDDIVAERATFIGSQASTSFGTPAPMPHRR